MKQLTKTAHRFWWTIPVAVYLYAIAIALGLGFLYLKTLGHIDAGSVDVPGYTVLFTHDQNFASLLTLWDGQWYRDIAERGYNFDYSLSSKGLVDLAFFPLFPLLAKLLGFLGIPFWLAGSLISAVSTLAAFVLLFRIAYGFSRSLWVGLFAILPLALNPAFFVTISAYTEGLSLLLVAVVIYGLVNNRYPYVIAGLLIASVTRGVGIPLLALILVVLAVEFWKNRKLTSRHFLALGAAVFAAGFWPLSVGMILGSVTASLEILSFWTVSTKYPLWIVPVAAILIYLFHRLNGKMPWQWQFWSVIYMVYIFSTTVMSAGIIRYALMALLPLPILFERIPAKHRSKLYVAALIVLLPLGVYWQSWWMITIWIPTSPEAGSFYAIP